MIHTVIWLTVLGIALLVPNVLAVRLALAGADEAPAISSGAKVIAPARRRVKRASPQLARKGYLWKALSPLIFGVTVILGLAVSGTAGYAMMGAGLLNLLWGFWGWDGYTPGQTGKR
ncbi:MAG: hypothetical protein ACOY94_08505 [Bacillota bacterium]